MSNEVRCGSGYCSEEREMAVQCASIHMPSAYGCSAWSPARAEKKTAKVNTYQATVKEEFDNAYALFDKKNKDYGNSFYDLMALFGNNGHDPMLAALPRLKDKYGRFENLTLHATTPNNEAVIDTLRDLATYAFMTAAYLEMHP